MQKQFKKIKNNVRSLSFMAATALLTATPVFAEGEDGGNAIMNSDPMKGLAKLLSDISTTLLWIAPTVLIILGIIFALLYANQSEQHDKDKYKKAIKNVFMVVAFVFGASGLIRVVAGYFGG